MYWKLTIASCGFDNFLCWWLQLKRCSKGDSADLGRSFLIRFDCSLELSKTGETFPVSLRDADFRVLQACFTKWRAKFVFESWDLKVCYALLELLDLVFLDFLWRLHIRLSWLYLLCVLEEKSTVRLACAALIDLGLRLSLVALCVETELRDWALRTIKLYTSFTELWFLRGPCNRPEPRWALIHLRVPADRSGLCLGAKSNLFIHVDCNLIPQGLDGLILLFDLATHGLDKVVFVWRNFNGL